jgi:SAM-dependent methyltransferase
LKVALETGLLAQLGRPTSIEDAAARTRMPVPIAAAVLDILVGLGLATLSAHDGAYQASAGLRELLSSTSALPQLAASLGAALAQSDDFRRRAVDGSLDLGGWSFQDPGVIGAQGDLAAGMAERAVPKLRFLPGLVPALQTPGALLLDVGAGAAGVSLTLCRHFPMLGAIALEPAPVSAAIARARVAEAGLADRIEVRAERVEHLARGAVFDLVFLPQMFLPDPVFAAGIQNIFAALKPGGWLLVAAMGREGADVCAAVARLRTLLWGGNTRSDVAVADQLREAGFRPVIRPPSDSAISVLCARRR